MWTDYLMWMRLQCGRKLVNDDGDGSRIKMPCESCCQLVSLACTSVSVDTLAAADCLKVLRYQLTHFHAKRYQHRW